MLSIRSQRDFQWSKSINNHRTRGEGKQPCAPMWCPGWPSVVMHEHLLPATCHGDGGVEKKWRMHRTSLRIWPALSLHCNPNAVRAALSSPGSMNRKGCWWPLVVGRHDFAGRFFIAQGSRKDKRSLIWFQYWQGSHDRCPWRQGTKAGWRCLRAVLPIALQRQTPVQERGQTATKLWQQVWEWGKRGLCHPLLLADLIQGQRKIRER